MGRVVMATKQYDLIVADPPWDFTTWSDKAQKSAKDHYPAMSSDDLANLPIAQIAQDDSILLLWATWPNLIDAIQVGQAWGFDYKTLGFIWLKRTVTGKHWHTGLGYYTRANSEPCLLFRRGKGLERESMGVHQLIEDTGQLSLFGEPLIARVGRHSQKPQLFFKRVDELFGGDIKKIELFARRKRAGWDCYGNEIDGRDIRDVLADGAQVSNE